MRRPISPSFPEVVVTFPSTSYCTPQSFSTVSLVRHGHPSSESYSNPRSDKRELLLDVGGVKSNTRRSGDSQTLNVFKGHESLRQYFNPAEQPPLSLVESPGRLDPFRRDRVRIYICHAAHSSLCRKMSKLFQVRYSPSKNQAAELNRLVFVVLKMLLNEPSTAENKHHRSKLWI